MPKKVPVIAIEPETGKETRYSAISEAAKAMHTRPSHIAQATVMGYRARGFYWRKENE